jgi:DNA-directed RNA polymerase specialized sigma24 family protein
MSRLRLLVSSQEEDPALVNRLRDGDWSALDALYQRYARQVFQRAWRVLHERQAAWDATQDTFVLFVAHLSCPCGRPVREWLFDASTRLARGAKGERR